MNRLLHALPKSWFPAALALLAASASSQTYSIAPEARRAPDIATVELARAPAELLAEHRRLGAALAGMKPGRKGQVDAFVVAAGLDSDPVFGREAREAGRVLERRYGAAGRTLVLTADADAPAVASPQALGMAFARIAELAGPEDALVVYATTHGTATNGLAFRDQRRAAGAIAPARLATLVAASGLQNRLVIISACYSGVFVPQLAGPRSVVVTAASASRPSFGCAPGNDWTFWGDALVNRALRKPQPFAAAFAEARATVGGWEAAGKLEGSEPQISVGAESGRWLAALDAQVPRAPTQPVGRSPAER